MTPPTKYPPTITPEEVSAYKRFSKEAAKQEKLLYGKTALQDKTLKESLGEDTKIDWATTFEWALSIKNMFDREGVEIFLTKIAPDLVTKLLAIEEKTKTFLTLARALLNGLGYGTIPLGAGGPAPPTEKLAVTSSGAPTTTTTMSSTTPTSSVPAAPHLL